eukprot:TRINITY_DN7441_c0_g1_i1.p1 TRINITY_DN7441_c0_g1~~TRINITY_DN7441_c0_g1_i1.p1  ORF type:complete len:355 (+),score=70.98 TRINITY_DN7441_c0_g1_i1:940-2004(+)
MWKRIFLTTKARHGVLKNKETENRIIKDRKIESQTIKILLLGSGGSGKSTFFKQMQILNSGGFSLSQRQYFCKIILKNIQTSALRLIAAAGKLEIKCDIREGEINFIDEEQKNKIRKAKTIGEISDLCKQIWNNEGIQNTYKQRHLYQLPESTKYFFDKLKVLEDKDYVPNDQDILHSRVKTLGIYETRFVNENRPFNVTDVGGQQSQRRKWILCFEGVSAMIFWVNLNAFDTFCDDDPNTFALVESLQIFEELINNKILREIVPIIFFNKVDLFQEKIKEKNINICFPEYKGGSNFKETSEYIQNLFVGKMKEDREIYCHFTTATDTENISKVFRDIKKTSLGKILNNAFVDY